MARVRYGQEKGLTSNFLNLEITKLIRKKIIAEDCERESVLVWRRGEEEIAMIGYKSSLVGDNNYFQIFDIKEAFDYKISFWAKHFLTPQF